MREGAGPIEADHSRRERTRQPRRAHFEREQPNTKRVAIVGPSAASLTVAMGAMIHEIRRRGNVVACFTPHIDRTSRQILNRLHASVKELPRFRRLFSPLADQRSVARLVKAFRELRPHIVTAYSPKAAVLAGLAGRLVGIERRVAIIGELGGAFSDNADTASKKGSKWQRSLLRLAFRLNDTVVILNEENHKLLQSQNFLSSRLRQFPVNGTGIDLRQFPVAQLPPLDRGVIFLFVGSLDKRLGVHDFCEAARLLRAKKGKYHCLLTGPEMRGPNAFPRAKVEAYREFVQYLGPQADPRPYIARSHVVVLPALGDAIPLALMEAIAMGRPIITSTARGCRVVVREGSNGLLVPPGDAKALASAMARLLLRPDLIPAMARSSREVAEAQFDERRITGQLMEALGL
ncbi:MAG: glycosyltransferase [Alphaproteobacteria bacterium]